MTPGHPDAWDWFTALSGWAQAGGSVLAITATWWLTEKSLREARKIAATAQEESRKIEWRAERNIVHNVIRNANNIQGSAAGLHKMISGQEVIVAEMARWMASDLERAQRELKQLIESSKNLAIPDNILFMAISLIKPEPTNLGERVQNAEHPERAEALMFLEELKQMAWYLVTTCWGFLETTGGDELLKKE